MNQNHPVPDAIILLQCCGALLTQVISVCLKRSFICDIGPFLQLTLTCVLVIGLQSHLPSLALMFTFYQFFPLDVSFILE